MCYQLSLDTHVGSVRDSFAKKVQLCSFAHQMSVQLNSCKRSATEESPFLLLAGMQMPKCCCGCFARSCCCKGKPSGIEIVPVIPLY